MHLNPNREWLQATPVEKVRWKWERPSEKSSCQMDGEEESQLIFFTVALFRASTTNSHCLHIFEDTFILTKALKTVFPECSFDLPRDTFLHYQTDSLWERGKPQGCFMWKFNLWNEPGCPQNTSYSPARWNCVCGGVCLHPSRRREWVLILLFCFPNGFSQFIDLGAS